MRFGQLQLTDPYYNLEFMIAIRRDWKKFQIVFICMQAIIIFFAAHFVLSAKEEEGFFEIFTVEGFTSQFILHLFFLAALAFALAYINKKEMDRFYTTGKKRLLLYLLKALLAPIVVTFLFAFCYLRYHDVSFDIKTYINQLWPFFVGFFAFINVLLLLKFLLKKLMFSDVWLSSTALQEAIKADTVLEVSIDRKKELLPVADIGLYVREGRSVAVYLTNGKRGLASASVAELKEKLAHIPFFFATGSWIVNFSVIEQVVDGQSIRSKELLLKFPNKNKLIVPKERVREFTDWYNKLAY